MLKKFFWIKKFLGRHGSGNFSSFLHGSGVDLSDNRHYTPGDEKRAINWKMSAKYDTLFVNLFHDEKAIDVHLCCDVNYNWKGDNLEKFCWFFAELTEYFQSRKAHISGLIGDQTFLQLEKPAMQKSFLETLMHYANKKIPLYTSSLCELLTREVHTPKKRLIIIVSDFLAYGEEERNLVGRLREKHEVKLVQVNADQRGEMKEALMLDIFSH